MISVSVIIITKNESENILDCITSARKISTDIIVVDSGSHDNTPEIAVVAGARVIEITWQGFGAARNLGADSAINDWVFALDADERVSDKLAASISAITNAAPLTIYGFKRQNYFIKKKIRFGDWGKDKVFRLYNRKYASWNLAAVHESLVGDNLDKDILNGYVKHYTVSSLEVNDKKTNEYALLSAKKYLAQGKKAGFIKQYLSPIFNFIRSYIILLGFLDGKEGYIIAKSIGYYTWLKYHYLQKLKQEMKTFGEC